MAGIAKSLDEVSAPLADSAFRRRFRPAARERVGQLGYEPVESTPEEFAAFFAAEPPGVTEPVRIPGASVD